MSVASVNNSSSSDAAALFSDGSSRVAMKTLGQEDFLNLLVTQMKAQDPLNPQKDTDFIAQMAQFSSLEQAKSTQAEIAQLRADQQVLQADALLGQSVVVMKDDDTTAQGIVTAVNIEAGTPRVTVDGKMYNLDQVITVQEPPIAA